jgi:acetyl-CoA C-acetyltransferase
VGRRAAAIAGLAEWAPKRVWDRPMFALEAAAELAEGALADAGIETREVDGLVVGFVPESPMFGPSAAAEYLAVRANFAETVDLGGATACGMIWRAAAAIELGVCETVLVLCPMVPAPPPDGADARKMSMPIYLGGDAWGSPQGQFEIPAGLVAATPSFAMVAQRYIDRYGLREETLAKIAVAARTNAQANPKAIFYGKPITVDDVMRSPRICDPLKLLEIVMPCFGGGAVVVTTRERAARARHRPVLVSGFGEHLTHKSITYAPDLLDNPIRVAAERAFAMAGATRPAVDLVNPYDCYTITVLVTLENAGFCGKGEGERFVTERDLTFRGDFPLNTHGGQLGCGQAGLAGGLSHATEAVLQLQGRAGERQLRKCDLAYVNGTGGMMAEQVALILQGA